MELDSPSPEPAGDLPFGAAVPGRANMVYSPHAQKNQLVDVAGMGVGQIVKCPYTGKLFKVPPSDVADLRRPSVLETPPEKKPAP